jgi:hypothetical protein
MHARRTGGLELITNLWFTCPVWDLVSRGWVFSHLQAFVPQGNLSDKVIWRCNPVADALPV